MQFSNNLRAAVFMVTYNHAHYVEQAIESVMMQKTNFPFKLFIGEDCSTDETRSICLKYKEKYSDKIELLLTEKNIGGRLNALNVYSACFAYGDYTAICEGDDYWSDPLKLQKQVDFLEANPDFVICFHNVVVLYEDRVVQSHLLHDDQQKEVSVFEDLAKENFIPTLSCVFRNHLFKSFPNWIQSALGDWILHLLNAEHGKIKYFTEAMGVYRVHSQGIWGEKPIAERLVKLAKMIQKCRSHFYPRGNREFTQALNKTFKNLCLALFAMFETGDYKNFRHYYHKVTKARSSVSSRIFSALTARYFVSYIPLLRDFYKIVTKAKQ